MASIAMSQLPKFEQGYLGWIKTTSSVTRHAVRETRNSEVTGSEIKGFNKSTQEE